MNAPAGRRLTDLDPAPFALRIAAFLVDVGIAFVAVVVLLQLVLDPLRTALGPGWGRVGWFYVGYSLLTVSLPLWFYFAGYESGADGATPGKRWLGLRVAGAEGGAVSLGRALLRTVLKMLPLEVAHIAIAVPTNPFIDPLTATLTLPSLGSLGPGVHVGLLFALLLTGGTLLSVALHPDRRALHDLATRTWVVDARAARVAAFVADAGPGHGNAAPV